MIGFACCSPRSKRALTERLPDLRTALMIERDDKAMLCKDSQALGLIKNTNTSLSEKEIPVENSNNLTKQTMAMSLMATLLIGLSFQASAVAAETKIIKNANGSSTETRTDGTKIITNANGSSIETRADGTEIVRNADHSSEETRADGTKITTNADGSSIETRADGTEIVRNADHSSEETRADGTKITTNADGSSIQTNPDGSEVVTNADGTKEIIKAK